MTDHRALVYLLVAGALECSWAIGLKYSDGFTRPWPTAVTIVAMILSFWLLANALKVFPVGTGYAIWTGIGAAGTAVLGMVLFAEPATPMRIACIGLIVAGIVGLRFGS